jgi:exopolyphosphatase/guanosine-5'-triphosphate,3'-diphosphate pyrophosphatase
MKIAILDLGTNVYNLLLAHVNETEYSILKIMKVAAKLGEGGLADGILSPAAFSNSEYALKKILIAIEAEGDVEKIYAFATSAVRDAKNGAEFVKNIKSKFDIDVEVISGEREADLIFKGVSESMFLYDETVLVLDIGGGSNEFIIARKNDILWKKSFPIGVARMKEMFSPSDPIKISEVEKATEFFDTELSELWAMCEKFRPEILIGASGSFDTLREMMYFRDLESAVPCKELDLDKYRELHKLLLISNKAERLRIEGMSPLRADFMVLASVFIIKVIERSGIRQMFQSAYSLKEGVLFEKFYNLNKGESI